MRLSLWRRVLAVPMVVLAASSAASVAVAHGVVHVAGVEQEHGDPHGHSHGHSHDHDTPAQTELPTLDHERHGGEHAHLEFDSRLPERADHVFAPLARPDLPDFGEAGVLRGAPWRGVIETPQGHSRASPRQPRAPPRI